MHPVEEVAAEEVAVLGVVRTRGHAPGTVNGDDEPPAHLLVREAATMAGEARLPGGHVRAPARGKGDGVGPVVAEGAAGVVPGPRRPRPRPGPARRVEAGRPPGGGSRRSRVRRTGEKGVTA